MELETFRWLLTDDGQALLRQATELVDAGQAEADRLERLREHEPLDVRHVEEHRRVPHEVP